jgi:hypothetical protein
VRRAARSFLLSAKPKKTVCLSGLAKNFFHIRFLAAVRMAIINGKRRGQKTRSNKSFFKRRQNSDGYFFISKTI